MAKVSLSDDTKDKSSLRRLAPACDRPGAVPALVPVYKTCLRADPSPLIAHEIPTGCHVSGTEARVITPRINCCT